MHVLSTPPAFVLSQDQTLHRDLEPEKQARDRRVGCVGLLTRSSQLAPEHVVHVLSAINFVMSLARHHPHWLLADDPLFRFQGATQRHTSPHGRCPCPVLRCQRVAERDSALPRASAQTAEVLGCRCAPIRGRNLATIAWLPSFGQRVVPVLIRSGPDGSASGPFAREQNVRPAGLVPALGGRDRAPGGC